MVSMKSGLRDRNNVIMVSIAFIFFIRLNEVRS